jgi:cyclic beta-1,2-glucan synthetase
VATSHHTPSDVTGAAPLLVQPEIRPRAGADAGCDAARVRFAQEILEGVRPAAQDSEAPAAAWTVTREGSCRKALAEQLKDISGAIQETVQQLLQITSTGIVLSGRARTFLDNASLTRMSLQEAAAGIERADDLPRVKLADESIVPRAYALAKSYLQTAAYCFDLAGFRDYVADVQFASPIEMAEAWHLKPFLNFAIVEQIAAICGPLPLTPQEDPQAANAVMASADAPRIRDLVGSLQAISDLDWKTVFCQIDLSERILREDRGGTYARMDFASREAYRAAVAELAKGSKLAEHEIATHAIDLAHEASELASLSGRARERRSHVGYFLVDKGRAELERTIGFKPTAPSRLRAFLLKFPDYSYLAGIELLALGIMGAVVALSRTKLPGLLVVALFLIPALDCAVSIVNMIVTRFVRPQKLARLDFSAGVPGDCRTMVVVPTLLTSEEQARHAVRDLEIRYLGNRDANIHFALLTDPPDAETEFDEKDALAPFCSRLIDQLNAKYAGVRKGGFFHFHRNRVFNEAEGFWMGWERKRGKLLDFNRFLLNQADNFSVKTGDLSLLEGGVKYVITLDLDTQLPREAAHKLIGTLAHPLNRAAIDAATNTVVEGYGILQPRVDTSIKSAGRSRLASLLSGDTSFDIYTRAVSDVYQDLFGEGIFTGKGIYEVETFQKVLAGRFPNNAILSHDLIEGAYARAGLVSDIEVVDDYPSHFSAFSRRKHRWVRGDWQIIFWLLPRVPDNAGHLARNPLSSISRWKIVDNLRRSLTEFATFALLLCGWLFLPGRALYWTLAALAIIVLPTYFQFAFSIATAGKALLEKGFWKGLLRDFASAHAMLFIRLTFLCHQTLVTLDAVVRTMVRTLLTRRKMLEWETAAESETTSEAATLVDSYLDWAVLLAFAIGALVAVSHPASLAIALPFLVLWASSKLICDWLNQPLESSASPLKSTDRALLRNSALRTWRFFREFSNREERWLVPDIVQAEPPLVAHRVSTTNLGLLLNSRQAAVDLGYLTLDEFIHDTHETLATVDRMEKHRGQLYNWYDNRTLEPVKPLFVSTVDNGNLLCSFWTLKHGCLEAAKQPLFGENLWKGVRDYVELLSELAAKKPRIPAVYRAVQDLKQRFEALPSDGSEWIRGLSTLDLAAVILEEKLADRDLPEEIRWWISEFSVRVGSLIRMVSNLAPWLSPEFEAIWVAIDRAHRPELKSLTVESAARMLQTLDEHLASLSGCRKLTDEASAALPHLRTAMARSREMHARLAATLAELAAHAARLAEAMDFSFLYNAKKKMVSIGYDGDEKAVSKYHYDLMASEARAAVFCAIAKNEMPQDAWFQLDRTQTNCQREDVLVSWTGTMFEYLMPALWMRTYPGTMLDHSAHAAVLAQQRYARGKSIPWGISESSSAQRNPDGHYRYFAFGVPGLGLNHDGASDELVVSPYSTFLALAADPRGAISNLERMKKMNWLSTYGFYEAGDFTPSRQVRGERHQVVRNWMAHHQGMTLLAIANALCDSSMQRRFHAEPGVMATERLLHEKQPTRRTVISNLLSWKHSWTELIAKRPDFLRRDYWGACPEPAREVEQGFVRQG